MNETLKELLAENERLSKAVRILREKCDALERRIKELNAEDAREQVERIKAKVRQTF